MRRKDNLIVTVRPWERRRYWSGGAIVDFELWHGGRLLPRPPRNMPTTIHEVDYCATHRTRIYADLPCQFCGERPGISLPERREAGRSSLPLGVLLSISPDE